MIILIGLTLIVIAGIALAQSYTWEALGMAMTIAGGILLFVALVTLPLSHFGIEAKIAEFEMTRKTIEVAREYGDELEKAAIQHKIIESNQWLAKKIYWNDTLFDIWIPDEVTQLKQLK